MRQIITTLAEAQSIVFSHLGQKFAFDIETTGLNPRKNELVGIALYFESGDAYYFVVKHTKPYWTGGYFIEEYIPVRSLIATLAPLFTQDIVACAHNAKFDLSFLYKAGLPFSARLFDTLLAAQLLDENRKNGLKELSPLVGITYEKYSAMVVYPGFGKSEILGAPLEGVAEYAMNDVEATFKLYDKFHVELAENNLQEVFNNIWMPLLFTLLDMESAGIALDLTRVQELRKEYVTKAEEYERVVRREGLTMIFNRYAPADIPDIFLRMATEEQLENAYTNLQGDLVVEEDGVELPILDYEMLGKNKAFRPRIVVFNTGSSKQLHDLVFDWSGVKIPDQIKLKRNASNNTYKVDKDNLEVLIFFNVDHPSLDLLRAILEWRKATKFIGTYLDRFLKDADADNFHSIYTSFNQAIGEVGRGGTATGRLSSSSPNLQNIPSRYEVGRQSRQLFVRRPNKRLIVADYNQMELRLMAHYANDPVLIEAFEQKQDLHILTAAAFAQTTYDDLLARYKNGEPGTNDLRQLGKTGNFALAYGMGAEKFRRYLIVNNKYHIDIGQAAQWIEDYNSKYEASTKWKKRVWSFVGQHGYVKTIRGRVRRLPSALSTEKWIRARAERQGVNAIIQGSCGDIICEVMPTINVMLKELGGNLLLQVHDELVAEVPEQHAELAAHLMETTMVGFINPILRVPMQATAHLGDNWGDAKAT